MESDTVQQTSTASRIIGRFAHLLSAQGVEAVLSTILILFLAWLDKEFYGQVNYAIAAGAIAMKIVQWGLYYPQVNELTEGGSESAPEILSKVNIIKLALLIPTMVGIWVFAQYQGLSQSLAFIVFLISLGFGLESVSETFFADLRVRGEQKMEARIKMVSMVVSYGYGIVTAALGFPPILIALFKLISSVVRVVWGFSVCRKAHSSSLFVMPKRGALTLMFMASNIFALIQILGVVYNKTNIFFLEKWTGVEGVATYSATWNLVDPVSVLASEQLLGWVIFPVLSALWWKSREEVAPLVRTTALWLLVISAPIMFFLANESDLLIGLIYPAAYSDAAWMQKYLVVTILLSFESNLFAYVMMVAGAQRLLLAFAAGATVLNLGMNLWLVPAYGLLGGCLVIVGTKAVMAIVSAVYCQQRLRLFRPSDLRFPAFSICVYVLVYAGLALLMHKTAAGILSTALYVWIVWKFGRESMGRLPRKEQVDSDSSDSARPAAKR